MQAPDSLEKNLLFLAGEIAHQANALIQQGFRAAGFNITAEQFSVLVVLWYEEGISQQDLAGKLKRDKTTIARVVKNMEIGNLLVRLADKSDLRKNLIYLTPTGRQVQNKLVMISGQVYIKALMGISDSNMSQGIRLMSKILKNLNA